VYIPEIKVSVVKDGSIKADIRALDYPAAVAEVARQLIGPGEEREHFLLFCLDARSKIKSVATISIGTMGRCWVHPREVFRVAIVAGATAVVVCHNHPSGDCTPSSDDVNITRRLARAGKIVGIPVMDHVILGAGTVFSFREQGLLS
jgi:DNA repair protein RadC